MTKTPFASAAIVILGLLACSGEAAAAPIAPTAVAKPSFQMPGPQQVTFRRRYYRSMHPIATMPRRP